MPATDEAAPMMVKGSAIAFGERINVLRASKWSSDGDEAGASAGSSSYFVHTSYTALSGVTCKPLFSTNDNHGSFLTNTL
jgi:hypothetical protein